jgi:ubiquinone biosynthesis protein UbiJ
LALAVNHLLYAEPLAAARLVPHAGRCIELRFGTTGIALISTPPMQFVITPAGLLDPDPPSGAAGSVRVADALVTVDPSPLSATSALLAGAPPPMTVDGDVGLVADIRWLLDNLRWDVEGDLERLIGPAAAHASVRVGAGFAAAARGALDTLTSMRARGAGR